MYITKYGKTFHIEVSASEESAYRSRISKGMFAAEQNALREQERIANLATCPDCHLKCTVSGYCIKCNKDCRHLIPKRITLTKTCKRKSGPTIDTKKTTKSKTKTKKRT